MSIWSEREPNLKKQSKYSSKNTENGTKFKGLTNYWTGKTILNLWPFQYRPLTNQNNQHRGKRDFSNDFSAVHKNTAFKM